MSEILVRAIMTIVMVSLGAHGIGYGLETNGGATRDNPAWRLVCSYFELEKAVLLLIGFYGAIAFGLYLLFALGKAIFGPPPPETEEEKEKREAAEREKRRAAEQAREEEEHAAYLAEEALRAKREGPESPRRLLHADSEKDSAPSPVPSPAPKTPTSPEELKQRAIRQLFKG